MKQNKKKQLLHEKQLTRCCNTHGAGHITLCGIFDLAVETAFTDPDLRDSGREMIRRGTSSKLLLQRVQ